MPEEYKVICEVCMVTVTTILGLAYPFFSERINRIYDNYGTRVISEKFEREPLYRAFKIMMRICIIELFVFPFIVLASDSQFWCLFLITIQAICVFSLCVVIVNSFNLVMTYLDPFRYLRRAKKKESEENIFQILQILIVKGAKGDTNDDLYNDAIRQFGELIMSFQHEQVIEWKKSKDDDLFIYPPYIFQTLFQLRRRSVDPENVLLYKRVNIVEFLYNITEDFHLTEQVYKFMWLWINRMAEAGYNDWMKKYWSTATQYYNLKMDHLSDVKNKEKFREIHLMVGVLLFYLKRYDALRYAFAFSNSLPPKYPLIPNTFFQIFDYCEKFPWSDDPFYISNNYWMVGDYEGAKTEDIIESRVLDYVALLMVRLYSVNDYNITYSDPMDISNIVSTYEEKKHIINRAETIMFHLEKISDDTIKALDFEIKWKQDAIRLLRNFINECQEFINNIKNKEVINDGQVSPCGQIISDKDRQNLRCDLIEASKKDAQMPLNKVINQGICEEPFLARHEVDLSVELKPDNYSKQISTLGASVIQVLYVQIKYSYCCRLLQNGAVKTYSIAYRDFGDAMERISLTHDYALVTLNIPTRFYKGIAGFQVNGEEITYQCKSKEGKDGKIKVYGIRSYIEEAFLIMKKGDVPTIEYRNLEESEYDVDEYCEIEPERHLYSNINNVTKENPKLRVEQGFYVHIPNPFRYVCIRILYSLESDATVVSSVEPIKNLIP